MSEALHTISIDEEEETIIPSFDEDEHDIGVDDEGSASSLLAQANLDEKGHGDDHASSSTTVRTSVPSTSSSSSRPGRRHHPPPSLPSVSSTTKVHSTISSRLKDHFQTQTSGWSTSTIPTIAADPPGDDFQEQQRPQEEQTETNISHNHNSNEQQQSKPISAASLVVCGVDGTVYTLDAYTGQLRGMFASGPALVYSSSTSKQSNDDAQGRLLPSLNHGRNEVHNHKGDEESNAIAKTSPRWSDRIIPGLDGKLYRMEDDIGDGECADDDDDGMCKGVSRSIMPQSGSRLKLLPITFMDVVDSPISTCHPGDDPAQQQQCGIVVGSKKTTVYAIDPRTGKVQWTQDPHGSGGGRGFTTHPPPNKSPRGLTVLLQREDYAVRNLDTDDGRDLWKLELGKFSALDFDVDAHNRGRNRDRDEENEMKEREEDSAVGVPRRGTAAGAASANLSRKDEKTSPVLGGTRKHGALHEHKEHHHGGKMFQEDDFDDHSHSRGLPSIAFGEVSFVLFLFSSLFMFSCAHFCQH